MAEVVMKAMELPELFAVFLKIGCLAFGGGYTVIALLQKETVEARGWLDNNELTDIMAISQTLPGIITVNAATMIGYRRQGLVGATLATAASILPTFILILVLTHMAWGFTDNPLVRKAFTGILLGVAALILNTLRKTGKTAVNTYADGLLALFTTVLLLGTGLNVALVILLAGGLGWVKNLYAEKRGAKKHGTD
ncbi:chromate transporter [Acididesulfobacillus acetoxydans]|uniref:chromate transporter n=1 Tax=Acididesulfobacillus acetoxydans TaxID=1561005 RepID=UPI001F10AF7D|nr:chromate transporter [Acididesulfobacillus acetoxydans]